VRRALRVRKRKGLPGLRAPSRFRRVGRGLVVAAALAAGMAAPAGAACPGPAWAAWGRALEAHTREISGPIGVAVDYRALGEDPAWREVVGSLGGCRPAQLASRAERLAFWINAYNILAIEMVLDHHPVESIRDIGWFLQPVWGKEAGTIGGRAYSLDEIEHEILRPMGEPRIHGAIVCASVSCPPLRREPYVAKRLDAQLDENLRRWLADPQTGARLEGGTLYLSKVFDWFSEDFEPAGGVVAFVRPYLPEAMRRRLPAEPRVRFLDYDWTLNSAARASRRGALRASPPTPSRVAGSPVRSQSPEKAAAVSSGRHGARMLEQSP